jgi:flagellar hook-associated protein 1 FlgK
VSLDGVLSVSTGGIQNINRQMALVSQNVANASTPDYAAEISTQYSMTANGEGMGVHSGPAVRNVDVALQGEVFSENATVTGLQTRQTALNAIDSVQGTPGQGGDIASLLGKVQDQFSTLLNNPDSLPQQTQTVSIAATFAQAVNSLSNSYTAQRQAAQDDIVHAVQTVNSSLSTIGSLSIQIIGLQVQGRSTADLESQRDTAVHTLSQLLDVKVLQQPNGDMLVTTSTGLMLPTHGGQITTMDASMQTGTFYPGGGVPPIMLGGVDVTSQFKGGRIGADINLRDTTLPTYQAELDEFAQTTASRFDAQGLTLFTDPTGAVPASAPPPVQNGYVGFAATIQVNPAVQADPSLVRDGTHQVVGNPAGPSAFVPNPPGGPAGFTTMIQRVLNYTFGMQAQSGVPQPAPNMVNLGPGGNLNAPFAAPTTVGSLASTIVASQAQDSATTTTQLGTEQAVQSALSTKLSATSGVSMDTEMSHMIQLQNAYGANAKVIAAVQAMWNQLLTSIT